MIVRPGRIIPSRIYEVKWEPIQAGTTDWVAVAGVKQGDKKSVPDPLTALRRERWTSQIAVSVLGDTQIPARTVQRRQVKGQTELKIQCGCGFSTNNPLTAQEHVEKTGHTMEISGRVYPVHEPWIKSTVRAKG